MRHRFKREDPCPPVIARNVDVIARPIGPKQSPPKESLENQYRHAEKQKAEDPEQGPLDQPPEGFAFCFFENRVPISIMRHIFWEPFKILCQENLLFSLDMGLHFCPCVPSI